MVLSWAMMTQARMTEASWTSAVLVTAVHLGGCVPGPGVTPEVVVAQARPSDP
jgi:hypothetical protein